MRSVEVLGWLAIAVSLMWLVGCGASAIENHAKAAAATRVVLDRSGDMIEDTCGQRAAEAAQSGATADEGEAAVRVVRERCEAAAAAHEVARRSWVLWVEGLLAAHLGDVDLSLLLGLVSETARLYAAVVAAAQALGAELPALPSILQGFTGGDQ